MLTSNEVLANFFANHQGHVVLKIDVENYELPVLLGGDDFFKLYQPIIFIELLKENLHRVDIYNLIMSYGYKCVSFSQNNFQVIESFEGSESTHDNYLFIHHSKIQEITKVMRNFLKNSIKPFS